MAGTRNKYLLFLNHWNLILGDQPDKDLLVKESLLPFHPELFLSRGSYCIVRTCSHIHGYMVFVDFLFFLDQLCLYYQERLSKVRFQGSNQILMNQILRKSCQTICIFNKTSHRYTFHEEPCVLLGWIKWECRLLEGRSLLSLVCILFQHIAPGWAHGS